MAQVEAGDPTVRDVLPWQLHALRVAEKAKAQGRTLPTPARRPVEEAHERTVVQAARPEFEATPPVVSPSVSPPSGVRMSKPRTDVESEEDKPLSFQVYTPDDLQHRTSPGRGRKSQRARALPKAPWGRLAKASYAVCAGALGWVLRKGKGETERASARDVLRARRDAWLTEARACVRFTDWKKIGLGMGVGFGTVAVLVGLVVTAAELSDDLKPAAASGVHLNAGSSMVASTRPARSEAPAIKADNLHAAPAQAIARADAQFTAQAGVAGVTGAPPTSTAPPAPSAKAGRTAPPSQPPSFKKQAPAGEVFIP